MEPSRTEDTALSKPTRAELLLEKTELEDQIREITPYRKKKRNGGLGLIGLAATALVSGILWAEPGGFLIALLALIFSIPAWFFFGLSAADVRLLERKISVIEERMRKTKAGGEMKEGGR